MMCLLGPIGQRASEMPRWASEASYSSQGSYGSWKTWKSHGILKIVISRPGKVMKNKIPKMLEKSGNFVEFIYAEF